MYVDRVRGDEPEQWERVIRYKLLKFMNLWFEEYLDPDWVEEDVVAGMWANWLDYVHSERVQAIVSAEERGLLLYFRHFSFSGTALQAKLARHSVALTESTGPPNRVDWLMQSEPKAIAEQMVSALLSACIVGFYFCEYVIY